MILIAVVGTLIVLDVYRCISVPFVFPHCIRGLVHIYLHVLMYIYWRASYWIQVIFITWYESQKLGLGFLSYALTCSLRFCSHLSGFPTGDRTASSRPPRPPPHHPWLTQCISSRSSASAQAPRPLPPLRRRSSSLTPLFLRSVHERHISSGSSATVWCGFHHAVCSPSSVARRPCCCAYASRVPPLLFHSVRLY
jgi:hypothetical protein